MQEAADRCFSLIDVSNSLSLSLPLCKKSILQGNVFYDTLFREQREMVKCCITELKVKILKHSVDIIQQGVKKKKTKKNCLVSKHCNPDFYSLVKKIPL